MRGPAGRYCRTMHACLPSLRTEKSSRLQNFIKVIRFLTLTVLETLANISFQWNRKGSPGFKPPNYIALEFQRYNKRPLSRATQILMEVKKLVGCRAIGGPQRQDLKDWSSIIQTRYS